VAARMIDLGGFIPYVNATTLAIAVAMGWIIADALLGLYKVVTGTVPGFKD
jgi:hypothetical protein